MDDQVDNATRKNIVNIEVLVEERKVQNPANRDLQFHAPYHTNHPLCLKILKITDRRIKTNATLKLFGEFTNCQQIKGK